MLQRYALLILLTGLLGVAIAAWMLLNVIQPVYQSSTSMLVLEGSGSNLRGLVSQLENELESLGPLRALAMQGAGTRSSTQDLISILRSHSLAEKVVAQLPLKVLKEVQQMLAEAPAGTEQRLLVDYLKKQTRILPPDSQDGTLRVRVRMPQADLSARAANLYVHELQLYVGTLINREQGKQLAYLDTQLSKLEAELNGAEQALLAFQQRHRTVALDEEIKQLIVQLAELEAEELTANAALQDARARAGRLNDSASELSPDSPPRRNELELEVAGLQQRQQTLSKARQRYRQLLLGLPAQALELARIERQVNLKNRLYLLLQQQAQAARLDAARAVELFRVLDPALAPLKPVQPVKGLWLAISGIISLGLGIVMASVFDYVSGTREAKTHAPSDTDDDKILA